VKKTILAVMAIALTGLAACSTAEGYDLSDRHGRATQNTQWVPPTVPHVGFVGDLWTMPGYDCTYSRSGRPNEEAWVLIINPINKPIAAKDCTRMFYTDILDGSPIPGFNEYPRGSR
jgi:hypothetical protein